MINAAGETRPIAGCQDRWPDHGRATAALATSFKFLKSDHRSRMAKATIPGPPIVHFLRDADFVPAVYRRHRRVLGTIWSPPYRAEISEARRRPAVKLRPDRRVHAALSVRSAAPQDVGVARRRSGQADSNLCPRPQRHRRRQARGHDCRHAYVPRQHERVLGRPTGGYEPVAEAAFNMSERRRCSCSNTIRRAPATSPRCATRARTRKFFSVSSPPRIRR